MIIVLHLQSTWLCTLLLTMHHKIIYLISILYMRAYCRARVSLFTRPRRFGKTLNLSMLRRFFEKELDENGKANLSMLRRFFEKELDENGKAADNAYVFENLRISSCGERYLRHQQKYPVISLTMKSAKQPDFEMAYASPIDEIAKEYRRHSYVLNSDRLLASEKI